MNSAKQAPAAGGNETGPQTYIPVKSSQLTVLKTKDPGSPAARQDMIGQNTEAIYVTFCILWPQFRGVNGTTESRHGQYNPDQDE